MGRVAKVKAKEDSQPPSPTTSEDIKADVSDDIEAGKGKKRNATDEGDNEEYGNEMQKLLESFGTDLSKTMLAKRKKLEQYTNCTIKTVDRKVDEFLRFQHVERQKLNEEFFKQVNCVTTQWETDLEKHKDQEEKLMNLVRQQQKLFQQTRIVQGQRLKTLRQLHDQFTKSVEELQRTQQDQHVNVYGELRKEMALLQKKILMDTQHKEMASMKKSLQSMLFM